MPVWRPHPTSFFPPWFRAQTWSALPPPSTSTCPESATPAALRRASFPAPTCSGERSCHAVLPLAAPQTVLRGKQRCDLSRNRLRCARFSLHFKNRISHAAEIAQHRRGFLIVCFQSLLNYIG